MRIKCFKSNHALEILTKLNHERKDAKNFCDVTVSAGEKDVAGHKCILGAFSSLFSKMFTSEMREKYENKGKVQGVNGETLELVLDFIYTGNVSITSENVHNLFKASNYIEIPYLERFCEEFLLEDLDESNCLSIRAFAKLYNLNQLNEKAKLVIADRFEGVIRGEEFYKLEVEDLTELLQIVNKTKSPEKLLFQAMIDWIKHDFTERKKHLLDLFTLVNLDKLSLDFIRDTVVQEKVIKRSLECTNMCLQSILSRNIVEKSSAHAVMEERVDKGLIGFDGHHVYKYHFHLQKVSDLQNPLFDYHSGTAVRHRRNIFLISADVGKPKSFERMDLDDQESGWTQLAPISTNMLGFSSCCWNDYIYNYGGCPGDYTGFDGCQIGRCYNIHQNQWTGAPNMKKRRGNFSLVNSENILYAIGGYGRDAYLNTAEFMDPREGTWRMLPRMEFERRGLASVALGGKIYAIGGTRGIFTKLSAVERFDPVNRTWSRVADLTEKRKDFGACVVDEKIYVAGGHRTSVEVYREDRDSWEVELSIPEFKDAYHLLYL